MNKIEVKIIALSMVGMGFFYQLPNVFSQANPSQTFINPVIPGDHPDCTVSKIGNDFYTTGSSFNPTPVIYHSTDLVHWEAIAQPVKASWSIYGDVPGGGCWGGHIVYYDNKYWDFFSRANTMYYVTAEKPEGPWSMPTEIMNPSQLNYGLGYDNSIFIDDDGKWYLVVKNGQPNNGIVELGNDGQPTGVVYNLNWLNPAPDYPYSWAEGPVIWKYNGYYYYSFARDLAGGQKVMRSVTLTESESSWEMLGDFFNENDPQKAGSLFTSPNHSSNVIMLADSTSWIIHPLYAKGEWKGQGRQGLLNQVHYDLNGRPVADYPVNKYFTAPKLPSSGIPWMVPKSDFFTSETLNPEWSLLGYTLEDTYSLTDRTGWLRLSPKSSTKANTVIKNDGEHNYSLITRLEFNAKSPGDGAGLRIMRGDETSFVELLITRNEYNHKVIAFSFDNSKFEVENTLGNTLWLKIIRVNHMISGYFSHNSQEWFQVGQSFNISSIDSYSDFVTFTGTRQGLYVKGNEDAYFDLYIYRDAYTPMMAECPANQFGTYRASSTQGVNVLDSIHHNDWVLYAGVEFGNREYGKAADSVQFVASSETSGGNVEVWLDSIDTGTLIGYGNINPTGGWGTFNTFSAKVTQTTGRHDVYLRFKGSPTGRIFQLAWVKFISKNAPRYISSATTSDSTIAIKLDKPIIQPTLPTGFIVSLNGIETDSIAQIKLESSDSSLISVTLKKIIKNTDTIRISYHEGTIKTYDGLELVSFADNIVENLLPGSAPRIIMLQSNLNGDSVMMKFNKKMKSPSAYASEFKIFTDLVDNPLNSVNLKNNDSNTFVFALNQKIYYENIVTLDYTGTEVKSTDDGVLNKFTSLPVTNFASGYPPVIKSSVIRKTGSIYNIIVLKFDRPLADVSSQKDFFTLTLNGLAATIKTFKGNYDSIRFTISPSVVYGDAVKLSYSGGSVASIHNGLLASFTDYLIPNEIPVSIKIEEAELNRAIEVYPNPNNSHTFYYHINQSVIQRNIKLQVINTSGIILYEQVISSSDGHFELSDKMSKGLYFFKFTYEGSVITKSIIIQ
jgi:uncharacterized repeat protein (TIGR02059 family)